MALEKYWAGKLPQTELIHVSETTQAQDWQLQADAGITRVGVDGTLYDQVLDTTYLLGLAPARFKDFAGLDLYFAMARGAGGVSAMDLSKFFNSNYHYIVSVRDVCVQSVRCSTTRVNRTQCLARQHMRTSENAVKQYHTTYTCTQPSACCCLPN